MKGTFAWGSSQYWGAKKVFDEYFELRKQGNTKDEVIEHFGYDFSSGGKVHFDGDAFLKKAKQESRDLWSISSDLLGKCFKNPSLKVVGSQPGNPNKVTGLIAALVHESGCVGKEESFKDFDT